MVVPRCAVVEEHYMVNYLRWVARCLLQPQDPPTRKTQPEDPKAQVDSEGALAAEGSVGGASTSPSRAPDRPGSGSLASPASGSAVPSSPRPAASPGRVAFGAASGSAGFGSINSGMAVTVPAGAGVGFTPPLGSPQALPVESTQARVARCSDHRWPQARAGEHWHELEVSGA